MFIATWPIARTNLTDASGLAAPEKEGSQRMRRIADANRGDCKIVTAKDLAR